jgi:hypothetical protein
LDLKKTVHTGTTNLSPCDAAAAAIRGAGFALERMADALQHAPEA